MDYLTIPLAALFGIAAPFVISILVASNWTSTVKVIVSAAVSFAFAVLAVLTTQGLPKSIDEFFAAAGIVFSVATIYYKTYFEHTVLNGRLSAISLFSKKNTETKTGETGTEATSAEETTTKETKE